MTFVLGVDVGGTNTDAAIVEYPSREVKRQCKVQTTKDFSSGILDAIQTVLEGQNIGISSLMLGTTTFLNAVLQCSSDLTPVVVLRLCGPASVGYPPFLNFPTNLRDTLKTDCHLLQGGFEYDGREIVKINENEVREVVKNLAEKYRKSDKPLSIVISGIFSPIYPGQENQVEEILKEIFLENGVSNFFITKSHEIAQLGFLEREGASILNASLRNLSKTTVSDLRSKLLKLNLPCDVYLTQNDGTLISCEEAMKFPIFTFNSGPTNSLRGAFQLSGTKNAIVADIGGTSTDISVLSNGFPRPASSYVDVAGVRTNFRMPDTISIGLGGGSLVKFEDSDCFVGPTSVGYKIRAEAKCFGGQILVATDIAVANGAKIQGTDATKVNIPKEKAELAQAKIISTIAALVDKMKTSKEPIPLILVGGGSALIPDGTKIPGISEVIKPPHFDVANAVGATIAQVSATVEDVIDFAKEAHERQLATVREKAETQALAAGAVENSIEVFTDSTHLAYMPGRAMKVKCRAVGNLDLSRGRPCQSRDLVKLGNLRETSEPFCEDATLKQERALDFELPTPKLVERDGRKEWLLTSPDIHCMAIGAGILGTGGGGSPYIGTLETLHQLHAGKSIRVIDVDAMRDGECLMGIGYYGAPLIMTEKLGGAFKHAKASETLEWLLGKSRPGDQIKLLAPFEIGGCNSLAPLFVGAERDMPVVDCDFMGRAFPEYAMITPLMYGEDPCPAVLRDEKGTEVILTSIPGKNGTLAEVVFRNIVVNMGCDGGLAGPAISKEVVQRLAIKHSLSQIWKLGRDILQARKEKKDPLVVIEKTQGGKRIFLGKITEVLRVTEGGYNRGSIEIEGFENFANSTLHVDFQNENLIAKLEKPGSQPEILATVPDLISLVDIDSYQPILTEDLRYGLRVSVLVMPAHPLLTTGQGLKIVGPAAFGYPQVEYKPWGTYQTPFSVFS